MRVCVTQPVIWSQTVGLHASPVTRYTLSSTRLVADDCAARERSTELQYSVQYSTQAHCYLAGIPITASAFAWRRFITPAQKERGLRLPRSLGPSIPVPRSTHQRLSIASTVGTCPYRSTFTSHCGMGPIVLCTGSLVHYTVHQQPESFGGFGV